MFRLLGKKIFTILQSKCLLNCTYAMRFWQSSYEPCYEKCRQCLHQDIIKPTCSATETVLLSTHNICFGWEIRYLVFSFLSACCEFFVCWWSLQKVLTRMRTDITSVLIWIKAVWQSHIVFLIFLFENVSNNNKKIMKNYPVLLSWGLHQKAQENTCKPIDYI